MRGGGAGSRRPGRKEEGGGQASGVGRWGALSAGWLRGRLDAAPGDGRGAGGRGRPACQRGPGRVKPTCRRGLAAASRRCRERGGSRARLCVRVRRAAGYAPSLSCQVRLGPNRWLPAAGRVRCWWPDLGSRPCSSVRFAGQFKAQSLWVKGGRFCLGTSYSTCKYPDLFSFDSLCTILVTFLDLGRAG